MQLKIELKGLDKVQQALRTMGERAAKYLQAAGAEASEEIIQAPGLATYPAEGPGNQPPTPYYSRGKGMEYKRGNDGRSEKLGTQFTVDYQSSGVTIGNRASYAPYVIGEEQTRAMANIGWRRLIDVAREKMPRIVAIYQGWVDKLIKDAGL